MIGKICKIYTAFYDKSTHKKSFKWRPGLVISGTNGQDCDRAVLPVSTITISKYIDPYFDIPISISSYPLLSLDKDSYIRTGKQISVSGPDIGDVISDLRTCYPDLYIDVLARLEEYNKKIIDEAINI